MVWRYAYCLVAALSAGCWNATPRDAGTDAGPVNEDVLTVLLALDAASCERMLRCSTEPEAWILAGDVCRPLDEVRREALEIAALPGVSVDALALERCLARSRGECERRPSAPYPGLFLDECAAVIRVGDARCGGCPDGLVCALPPDRCAAWTCLPPAGLHDDCLDHPCADGYDCILGRCVECDEDADCGPERYCDRRHVCHARGALGAACSFVEPCRSDLVCDATCQVRARGDACVFDSGCASGLACLGGVCADPLPEGAPCDGRCGGELRCIENRCEGARTEGESCAGAFFGFCAPRLRCLDFVCRPPRDGDACAGGPADCQAEGLVCNPATGRCTSDPEGLPCGLCPSGSVCSAGGCIATALPGEPCSERRVCLGGVCEAGECVQTVPPTQPCDADRHCPPFWSCEGGACEPLPDLDEPCTTECRRGRCTLGWCTWPPPGAPCEEREYWVCPYGCESGVCMPPQTELGGVCLEGGFGWCAEGLDCLGTDVRTCAPACPD